MTPRRRVGLVGGLLAAALLGLSACSSPAPDSASTIPAVTSASAAPVVTTADTPQNAPSVDSSASASAAPSSVVPGPPGATATSAAPLAAEAPAAATLELPAAAPVSLTITAIGVSSTLSSLGRNPDGTVEVPSLEDPDAGAGWFRDSPEPGSMGPSVILGHVDSREFGPGVFYDLGDLQPGDTVEIGRDDGTVAVFAVDSVETVPKANFPTQQVYGNIDHAGLRLITCGGSFDENARSYLDNVIAFASLVSSRPA